MLESFIVEAIDTGSDLDMLYYNNSSRSAVLHPRIRNSVLFLTLLLGAAQVAGAVHGIEHGEVPDQACAQCLHGGGAGHALVAAVLLVGALPGHPEYRYAARLRAYAGAPHPYHSRAPPRCSS